MPKSSASVELRLANVGGTCECGVPHTIGYELRCVHELQCEFGTIGDPPKVYTLDRVTYTVTDVNPLILVGRELNSNWDGEAPWGKVSTFYTEGGRRFMRVSAANGSWIWELFEAHWWDHEPCNVYVARFPD